MTITIAAIQRFPVKGLSAESLEEVLLSPGAGLPGDRRYAITHGASGFDPLAPAWHPKINFVSLSRNERLAALSSVYDEATSVLTIRRGGRQVARGQLNTPIGRQLIEQFLSAYLQGDIPGAPRVVDAPGLMFSDTRDPFVSLLNAASLRYLERVVKRTVEPLRFRANLLLEGLAPWAENGWVGCTLAVGSVRLEVVRTIRRCPATNVNPATGTQDINIPLALQRGYGFDHCGIYARVISGGSVALRDSLTIEPARP